MCELTTENCNKQADDGLRNYNVTERTNKPLQTIHVFKKPAVANDGAKIADTKTASTDRVLLEFD
jgi:hypothetical protein